VQLLYKNLLIPILFVNFLFGSEKTLEHRPLKHCVLTYFTYLLTYLLTPWSRVLIEKMTVSQLIKNSPNFMEPEGLLPHLQKRATCQHPEPARSNPLI